MLIFSSDHDLSDLSPEAGGEVCEDGVCGVAGLLARDPEVLLEGPRDLGQHRLRGVVGVHRGSGSCKGIQIHVTSLVQVLHCTYRYVKKNRRIGCVIDPTL